LDADHFKQYNDYYGHQAGDECLRTMASVFASYLAPCPDDLVARYGGEEFAFISSTDQAAVVKIAQSCCLAIQDLNLPHALSPYEKVTVSIGIACYKADEIYSASALVHRADIALMQAKNHGRNQVVLADHPL
jgi:diguanylate cyclase (GGDEF)-like protein